MSARHQRRTGAADVFILAFARTLFVIAVVALILSSL